MPNQFGEYQTGDVWQEGGWANQASDLYASQGDLSGQAILNARAQPAQTVTNGGQTYFVHDTGSLAPRGGYYEGAPLVYGINSPEMVNAQITDPSKIFGNYIPAEYVKFQPQLGWFEDFMSNGPGPVVLAALGGAYAGGAFGGAASGASSGALLAPANSGLWTAGLTAADLAAAGYTTAEIGSLAAMSNAALAGAAGTATGLGAPGTWLENISAADLASAGYAPADVAALTQQGAATFAAPEVAGSKGFFDTLGPKVSEQFTPANLTKSAAKNAAGQLVFTGEIDPRSLATGTVTGGLTGAVAGTALGGMESAVGYSPTVADATWSTGATPTSQLLAATTTGGLQGAVGGAVQGGISAGLQGGSVAEGATRGAVTGGAGGLAGAASRDVIQSAPVQGALGNTRPAFDLNAYNPEIANAIWSEDATISPETADKAWGAGAGKWGMADAIWSEDATISPEISDELFGGTGSYTGEPNYIGNTIAKQIPGLASQVAGNWASAAMAPDAPSFGPRPTQQGTDATQQQAPGKYTPGMEGYTDWADVNEFSWRGPEQYSLLGKKVKFNSGSPFGQGTESYGNSNKFGL